MKNIHVVAFSLVIVGAMNWGLIGLFNINLVNMLFNSYPVVEQLVYVLVGASALYLIGTHKGSCKACSKK
ncbi:MAG: DUF378 domain-containing protein [Candidatus Pacebacteria bacterium]|nr:DUF378 domain-containing protein [Candidatus Paceibacterota bacterium]